MTQDCFKGMTTAHIWECASFLLVDFNSKPTNDAGHFCHLDGYGYVPKGAVKLVAFLYMRYMIFGLCGHQTSVGIHARHSNEMKPPIEIHRPMHFSP